MEIVSFKKKNNNSYNLIFKDNTVINLYDDTILKYNLLLNKKIASQNLTEILKFNNSLSAYYKALKYLTIKLRTKIEIEKYLLKNNFPTDIIKKVINRLEKEGYLNDEIYVKAYINDQINLTLKGPKRIKNELTKLGFKETLYNHIINSYSYSFWEERITKIITKKIKSNHNLSLKMLKEKIKQCLIKEGYFLEQIISMIENINENDNEEAILQKEFQKEYRKLSKKCQDKELQQKLKINLYRKGFDMSKIDNLLANTFNN